MANSDGHVFWYNQRWFNYTGTTPAEMEGWGWQAVHHPEMLPIVLAAWKNSLSTGKPFEMAFPIKGADGVFRQFLTRVEPVLDASLSAFASANASLQTDEQDSLIDAAFAS